MLFKQISKICYNRFLFNRFHLIQKPRCFHTTAFVTSSAGSEISLERFPPDRIRNFSIIAHVDHGKSTLADRLLEDTGTISKDSKNKQVLDKLQVERERGITVKAQTASLIYEHKGQEYLLNLIDTPGHVDFNYEVERSLAACEGVILLIDANQGIQAQTVANFYLAFEKELTIIPVLNKIDLKGAKPEEVGQQMSALFDFDEDEILKISAKQGKGIDDVLSSIIERIPPPKTDPSAPLQALLFDTWFNQFRGVVCFLAVKNGIVRKGERVKFYQTGKEYEVQEVGVMYPEETKTSALHAGQVGYMYANIKTTKEAKIGETIHRPSDNVSPLVGFRDAQPMVYAGVYPSDQSQHSVLKGALEKLLLTDASVSLSSDSSSTLGHGWRLGFLGLLHLDVFAQRLEQEFDANVVMTTPNVPYKVKIGGTKNIKFYGREELVILNPCHLPEDRIITECQEPMVLATLLTPQEYLGDISALVMDRRGEQMDQFYIDNERIMMKIIFPLSEVIVDFFDELKSITSGYASFDYEDHGYRVTSLTKLDVYFNGKLAEELTQLCHVSKARQRAKHMSCKLKESLHQQLFEIAIQVKTGSRVLARENIKARRKDVLAKCYGGDVTRKAKLLRKQAEGKKKMRLIGNVEIPKEAFINIVKR